MAPCVITMLVQEVTTATHDHPPSPLTAQIKRDRHLRVCIYVCFACMYMQTDGGDRLHAVEKEESRETEGRVHIRQDQCI